MTALAPVAACGLAFALEYRDFGTERGWTIHIHGMRQETHEEILRFDCFEHNPHFHLGWSYLDRLFVPIPGEADPFAWALDELRNHLPELLRASEAEELAANIDPASLETALNALAAQAQAGPIKRIS